MEALPSDYALRGLALFFWLIVGHCLADFSLQNDFIAQCKCPGNKRFPWIYPMMAHCIIHAAFVVFFTGSITLGILELIVHFISDYLKCKGKINAHVDQGVHIVSKAIWAVLAVL